MGTIQVFDHTADVGLRVTGADLDDLFQTAAGGLFDYIVANRNEVRPEIASTIELMDNSLAELLLAWLNELIFRCETQHSLYSEFEVHVRADPPALSATIRGEPIDQDRHILDHEVKAATRHGLTLERTPSGWMAEVVLDI